MKASREGGRERGGGKEGREGGGEREEGEGRLGFELEIFILQGL